MSNILTLGCVANMGPKNAYAGSKIPDNVICAYLYGSKILCILWNIIILSDDLDFSIMFLVALQPFDTHFNDNIWKFLTAIENISIFFLQSISQPKFHNQPFSVKNKIK